MQIVEYDSACYSLVMPLSHDDDGNPQILKEVCVVKRKAC